MAKFRGDVYTIFRDEGGETDDGRLKGTTLGTYFDWKKALAAWKALPELEDDDWSYWLNRENVTGRFETIDAKGVPAEELEAAFDKATKRKKSS